MVVCMTQPYAVSVETLGLACFNVCIDDKESYTIPQEKQHENIPQFISELPIEIMAFLVKSRHDEK